MMLIAQVMRNTHDNDNELFSFISIGAATRNVCRYLENSKDHEPDRERQAPENNDKRDKAADYRKAVENGLRQIERFESRYRRSDRS